MGELASEYLGVRETSFATNAVSLSNQAADLKFREPIEISSGLTKCFVDAVDTAYGYELPGNGLLCLLSRGVFQGLCCGR
jgi:hypothetical protein